MLIEDQVCSLELSKKLYELGVKQESNFYYSFTIAGKRYLLDYLENNEKFSSFSAFTAAELLEILPNYVTTKYNEPFNNFRIVITKFISVENNSPVNNFSIMYECDSTAATGAEAWLRRSLTKAIYSPNLANALAEMLIYLVESGLMTMENKND